MSWARVPWWGVTLFLGASGSERCVSRGALMVEPCLVLRSSKSRANLLDLGVVHRRALRRGFEVPVARIGEVGGTAAPKARNAKREHQQHQVCGHQDRGSEPPSPTWRRLHRREATNGIYSTRRRKALPPRSKRLASPTHVHLSLRVWHASLCSIAMSAHRSIEPHVAFLRVGVTRTLLRIETMRVNLFFSPANAKCRTRKFRCV